MLFLILGVATLSDYGINWDEPFHFNRGHAYLDFVLEGKKDYLDIPQSQQYKGTSDFVDKKGEWEHATKVSTSSIPSESGYRRSYFQSDVFNYEYFEKNDGYGHPAANGILSAAFNKIFYHQLGVLGDVEAHHLFEVFSSFLLIWCVAWWTNKYFNVYASIIASASLAFYPLFFAESHFNIKDPVQASFFGIAVLLFHVSVNEKNKLLLLFSAVASGVALGTKFNAIFIPFIITPWLITHYFRNLKEVKIHKYYFSLFVLYPMIVFIVFVALWPYLWNDPINNVFQMFRFYLDNGVGVSNDLEGFVYYGFNTFAWYWIIITTPIPILFFFLLGIVISVKNIKNNSGAYFLILVWFLVPLMRVSLGGATIYNGVRHILEFLPAMAIISGVGASYLIQKYRKIGLFVMVTSVFLLLAILYNWHPNQNVYFNEIVGGLKGAKELNIPYWGYNYGNVYLQGVEWINKNADVDSKLSLAIGNMVNIPRMRLRSDIDFSNKHLSAYEMKGEYVMEMSNNWGANNWYSYRYYDMYLDPVYEVKVDDVALLKIWKNDEMYLKNKEKRVAHRESVSFTQKENTISIDLGEEKALLKLEISHSSDSCVAQKGGYIRTSKDGKNWIQESETIDYPQIPLQWLGSTENKFVFMFTERQARYVYLDTQMENPCLLNKPDISIQWQ